jgi:hypothetical protein
MGKEAYACISRWKPRTWTARSQSSVAPGRSRWWWIVPQKAGADFVGEPAVSDEIPYEGEVAGDAPEEEHRELIESVDEISVERYAIALIS